MGWLNFLIDLDSVSNPIVFFSLVFVALWWADGWGNGVFGKKTLGKAYEYELHVGDGFICRFGIGECYI